MENLRWIATAALSAYACHLAVHHATPIDRALPLLAVAATLLAWASYPAVMIAVPLLVLAEIALPGEPVRLLAFGVVMAAAVGAGVAAAVIPSPSASLRAGSRRGTWAVGGRAARGMSIAPPSRPGPSTHARDDSRGAAFVVTLTAILLLRWIPMPAALIGRELAVLALALATVAVLGRTPFAIVVAVVTALATPAIPLRTLLLPMAVLLLAVVSRLFGLPRFALRWPSVIVVMFVMLFFPWSGIVARAFPYFLQQASPARPRQFYDALAPARSKRYAIPDGATTMIVSGANVAAFGRGYVLGRIDPGGVPVRIGDAADWGYMRRAHFYAARNPLPRDAAGMVREYGYAAWIDGSGRVLLPRGAKTIRVTADAALPADASLQVEGFE